MITINMDKAKNIAHNIRREKRAEEFKPYDEIIMKKIPNINEADAELERQKIRDKYNIVQENINLANDSEELKAILNGI